MLSIDRRLSIDKFLLFLEQYGSTFNVAPLLCHESHSSDLEDIIDTCAEFGTCCVTSAEVIRKLTSNRVYLEQKYIHPNNTTYSKLQQNKGYMSDNICNLLSYISYPALMQISIDNVVEAGGHILSIIIEQNRCYLIQSYGARYTYKVVEYPTLTILMNYFAIMFDEVSYIDLKISIYNKLTHNNATLEDYQFNMQHNMRARVTFGGISQPGLLVIEVSDFHLPLISDMATILQQLYDRIKDIDLPELRKELLDALTFLNLE